jgi:hypothetical protein
MENTEGYEKIKIRDSALPIEKVPEWWDKTVLPLVPHPTADTYKGETHDIGYTYYPRRSQSHTRNIIQ